MKIMHLLMRKAKLFTDKNVKLLFGMKKKTVDGTKSFLGFVNSVLNNYGVKIDYKRVKVNSKLSYKYFIKQEDFEVSKSNVDTDSSHSSSLKLILMCTEN
jgi:hypothetical protein